MALTFTAQLKAFESKAIGAAMAVTKQSAQEVFEIAQTPVAKGGNMPVLLGFLRNSLISGLNGSTSMTGPDGYVLAIAGMKAGDSMFGGWTANYAIHQEYGSQGRAGRFFMRGAAQQWQAIVAKNARAVQ